MVPFVHLMEILMVFKMMTIYIVVYIVVPVKRKVEISQNFVAFTEYMNFNKSPFLPSKLTQNMCISFTFWFTYLTCKCRLSIIQENTVLCNVKLVISIHYNFSMPSFVRYTYSSRLWNRWHLKSVAKRETCVRWCA